MVRGGSYSPEEDSDLAQWWVGVSAQHDEQDSVGFWFNVSEAYAKQSESVERVRSASSLQARWHTLQRLVQEYLAAERSQAI